ncbi:hypothetical protein PGH43_04280 [Legionella pneumophila 130b]|nr:hypothetical protein PGH43_04280 [Legionella pneumophila 130b]WBV69979.1 hypothetical protein PGH46_08755 [Legionella pneumophila]
MRNKLAIFLILGTLFSSSLYADIDNAPLHALAKHQGFFFFSVRVVLIVNALHPRSNA